MRIYLAGKVGKNDWRHEIVPGLRAVITAQDAEYVVAPPDEWPALQFFGSHSYVGPYFIGCDHGCFHGPSQHGCISLIPEANEAEQRASLQRRQAAVRRLCLRAVAQADLVFAYIESTDAFGTCFELGFAEALGKTVEVCAPEALDLSEWWLSIGHRTIHRGDPGSALRGLVGNR